MKKMVYYTVNDSSLYEIDKIKKSRFITRIFPIQNEHQVIDILGDVRKAEFKANHHCFYYKLLTGETRYSDDGEPSQTAGLPIKQATDSFSLVNILIVVSRIFGGIKLGTGGLIRAYGTATKEALENVLIHEQEIFISLELIYPYNLTNLVMNIISEFEAKIIKEDYEKEACLCINVNKGYLDSIIQDVKERSNGVLIPRILGKGNE